jgi:hypothetical protein
MRAAGAKRAFAAASIAGFLAVFVLARVSHPGHAAQPAASTAGASSAESDDGTSSFDFGSGSIAPSAGSAPSAQTQTS